MEQQRYTRRDHLIINIDTSEQNHCSSINAAKRTSRQLQSKGHIVTKVKSRNTKLHIKIYGK